MKDSILTTKKEIEQWLLKHKISNTEVVEIRKSEFVIDSVGSVVLKEKLNEQTLPYKFRNVAGNFDCSDNFLNDLSNSPDRVQGTFDCRNNQLIDLVGSPRSVGFCFLANNNPLISLKGLPLRIEKLFICENTQITSLEYLAEKTAGHSFTVSHKDNLIIPGLEAYQCQNGTYIITASHMPEALLAYRIAQEQGFLTQQLPQAREALTLVGKFKI